MIKLVSVFGAQILRELLAHRWLKSFLMTQLVSYGKALISRLILYCQVWHWVAIFTGESIDTWWHRG